MLGFSTEIDLECFNTPCEVAAVVACNNLVFR